MYIIDKNNDFYDHFSHIYGLDKSIVFDRRGSIILNDDMLVATAVDLRYYGKESRGHVLLEIGDIQYLIEISNITYKKNISETVESYDVNLLHTYEEHRHIYEPLVSLHHIHIYYGFFWRRKKDDKLEIPSLDEAIRRHRDDHPIDLPILANTKLTSILNAEKIWQDLQNYISSLDNDKDVSLPMTDVEKASTHGFDKHSFRHPIK